MHIKVNDTVKVISGNEKGGTGRVKEILKEKGRVVVAGLALRKRHVRPSREHPQGGRIQVEGTIDASNVLPLCKSCEKPTRLRVKGLEEGKKIRVCAKCGADYGEKY